MATRKYWSGQKGFTLIELLVVVAILGILAGIAVPRVMDAIDSARSRRAEADMTTLRDALERFYLDYGVFPPNLGVLTDKAYLDPNFKFKNSYGNYYFYAVRWDTADGTSDPDNLKDYVMGDGGQIPASTYSDTGPLPSGIALFDAGGARVQDAYFWGVTPTAPATTVTVTNYTFTKLDGSSWQLASFTLTMLRDPNVDKPTNPSIKYKGQL